MIEIVTSFYQNYSVLCELNYKCFRISRTIPSFIKDKIPSIQELYPTWDMINNKHDEVTFTTLYNKEVLSKIDAFELMKYLETVNDKIALLCWESPDKFCHRKIVAVWISITTGILVKEFTPPKKQKVVFTGFDLS